MHQGAGGCDCVGKFGLTSEDLGRADLLRSVDATASVRRVLSFSTAKKGMETSALD